MPDALPLFVYGTLQDGDVLARVTGQSLAELCPRPASLADYVVEQVQGASYPMLVARPGAAAPGLLLPPPDGNMLDRLIIYETNAYALSTVTITCDQRQLSALTFLPTAQMTSAGRAWSLTAWQAEHKARFLAALVTSAPL